MKSELQIQPRGFRANGSSAYCGMSRSTFLELVRTGKAPAPRRIGKGIVFWLRDDLDKWLESAPVEGGKS